MLSVNIPVFNFEVTDLVKQLSRQAQLLGIDYEIRVYDDCSEDFVKLKNRHVAGLPGVVYKELSENLGRSAIRNRMGLDAKKSYLLFIDADSEIDSENYIEAYIRNAIPGCVLCGGTKYNNEKPADSKKLLRWVYGRKREAISAQKRNSQKGFIITSNNFLIDSKVFENVHFRENIGPYGHEDTLLGFDLYRRGIHPVHIDNPVIHIGLEDSGTFLAKTRKGLENLFLISEVVLEDSIDFSRQVDFLRHYHKITSILPSFLWSSFFSLFNKLIERNLTGTHPLLFGLDLYKVGYYAELKRKNL